MFPAAGEPQSLEDHYLAQRHILLGALAVPPLVSAVSNIALLPANPYTGWPGVWMTLRIVFPLLLIPISSRTFQRVGLLLFIGLLLSGLFRW